MVLGELAVWLRRPWLLVSVIAIDVAGVVYGFYYYLPQFRETPVWLWPLVPDSPFAVMALGVALVLVMLRRSSPVLNLIGAALMVKVGLWTAVMLPWFGDHFQFSFVPAVLDCSGTGFDFRCADLNTYLFYLHLGMAAEAVLVVDLLPRSPRPYLWVLGAFLLHDAIDYAWPADHLGRGCNGLFPHTIPCDHLGATWLVTSLLSVGTLAAFWWVGTRLAIPSEPSGSADATTPPATPPP